MEIRYDGEIKKFNIYQGKKFIGRLSKKNPVINVDEGKTVIKEVITGIAFIDFFLYGIIGFFDIFSNYVDGDLIDCNIFLITNIVDIKNDVVMDDYGFCSGGNYHLRTTVFKTSLLFYTIVFIAQAFFVLNNIVNRSKEIISLLMLVELVIFICYFYIVVNLIHSYTRYKKFILERIGDNNGK